MAVDDIYTKLLMHFDGADNETIFIDEAGNTVSASGSTCIKSTQYKFGATAVRFGASGDYLNIPGTDLFNFGTDDFTIDLWVYLTSEVSSALEFLSGSTNGNLFFSYDKSLSKICLGRNNVAYDIQSTALANNIWIHIAITRKSGFMYLFKDGICVYSGSNTQNYTMSNAISGKSSAYIDELRVSKGIARWTTNFIPPIRAYIPNDKLIDILVIGGGGGGGAGKSSTYEGGGGGAGGFLYQEKAQLAVGEYAITVGEGGASSTNGIDSSIASLLVAKGGGHGTCATAATVGGSGGGAFNASGAAGTLGQGNAGGSGNGSNSGGGGGAGAVGYAGTDGTYPRQGGAGKACSISGSEQYYAGGGGGVGSAAGAGGIGGGGAGNMTGAGIAGTPNTGGGGGGGKSSGNYAGGAGGSGIVIIRYKSIDFGQSTGGTKTIDGEYTVHTFTTSGTFILSEIVNHKLTGSAIFGPFAIPEFIEEPESSVIEMVATIPETTNVDIYSAIVDDTPLETDYVQAINGESIPGMSLANAGRKLYFKVLLSTTEIVDTPIIRAFGFSISEVLNKNKIWLILKAGDRILNPKDNVRVQYTKATGTLIGPQNGQVEDFDVSFAPVNLNHRVFDPHDPENITMLTGMTLSSFDVTYRYAQEGAENITMLTATTIVVTKVGELPL